MKLSITKDTRYIHKFDSFIYEMTFNIMSFMNDFGNDKWTKNMLSITSYQARSIIQLMIPIVERISLEI